MKYGIACAVILELACICEHNICNMDIQLYTKKISTATMNPLCVLCGHRHPAAIPKQED